jgi:hypothetical protein
MSPWLADVLKMAVALVTASVPISALMVWVVKAIVRQEITDANKQQTSDIADKYMLSMKSNLTGAEIQRQLVSLEEDINEEELSRRRHAKAQLDTIAELTKGLAVMQAKADMQTAVKN